MNRWQNVKLEKVLDFYNGKEINYSNKGKYPVYGSNGVIGFYADYNFDKGIIIGRVGAYCGSININVSRFWSSDNTIVVLSKAGNFIEYLYYMLQTMKLNNYAGGSAQPLLTQKVLKGLKVKLPNLETQKKIAGVLSTYDELIENNNRRIEILEKIAEEIYKEWFVRMRFPGHENTRFEKGIPEGWEIRKVGDLGEVITGKTPSTKIQGYYGGDIMFVKTPDMHNNMFITETEVYLSEKGSNSQSNKLLPRDSIMVSCIGTGGVVSINMNPSHTNQQINSVILNNVKLREWAYFTLKSMKETIMLFGATGATMTNLSKGKFERLKLLYPIYKLLEEFNSNTKDMFEQIKNLTIANQNLAKQRDLLLLRLMNGTIEVN